MSCIGVWNQPEEKSEWKKTFPRIPSEKTHFLCGRCGNGERQPMKNCSEMWELC